MTTLSVVQALAAASEDVRSVRKDSKNEAQRFNFRGIDAVMNACGPAFRKHGIICIPQTEDVVFEPMQLASGKTATRVVVKIRYVFYGPGGDSLEAVVYGESFDMGDKALAKAYSVAYRTCLLQTLTIPTDDPDPDAEVFEAAPKPQRKPAPKPAAKPTGEPVATRATVDELHARLASLSEPLLEEYGNWRAQEGIPKLSESLTVAQAGAVIIWLNENA
jgi:hypothetical protein